MENRNPKTTPRNTNPPPLDAWGSATPKPSIPSPKVGDQTEAPEETRDPSIGELVERVKLAVWNHQEEQGKGPITFEALAERLGLDDKGVTLVKKLVRSHMVENVVEVAPGRLAYTW